MKKLPLLSLLLFATVLFIGGCSSDPAPKEQFKANGESFNFKNAKLYLMVETEYSNGNGNFLYRDYILTDGTYVSGDGWSLDDFTDATYYFAFEPVVPAADGFASGNYNSVYSFTTITENSLYFYGEDGNTDEYYESMSENPDGTFVLGGDMDDGGIMTIKFNGDLSHWVENEAWEETIFTGSILVKAEVIDVSL